MPQCSPSCCFQVVCTDPHPLPSVEDVQSHVSTQPPGVDYNMIRIKQVMGTSESFCSAVLVIW